MATAVCNNREELLKIGGIAMVHELHDLDMFGSLVPFLWTAKLSQQSILGKKKGTVNTATATAVLIPNKW